MKDKNGNGWNLDYSNYSEMVRDFMEKESPVEFGNSTAVHAAEIIAQFTKRAKESIEILTGTLHEMFYGGEGKPFDHLKDAARRLKDGAVRIITVDADDDDIALIRERVAEYNKENENKAIEYIPAQYTGEGYPSHFMIVDGKRYRIEQPHLPFDRDRMPEGVKALVCCNGPEKAREKRDFFNEVWKKLKEAY